MAEDVQNESGLTEVLASEILAKIENGESIEYDYIRVKDDLNINMLNIMKSNNKSVIDFPIKITNSVLEGELRLNDMLFQEIVNFEGTNFKKDVHFMNSSFRFAFFKGANFMGFAYFTRAEFIKDAYFPEVHFYRTAYFWDSNFKGYGDFREVCFDGDADFWGSKFTGEFLTFKNSRFFNPRSQEDACRRAKMVLEKIGDREEAGDHFYREMDASRKQKPWYYRYPEFVFIQLIFGYGVHPWRLIGWWGLTIIAFAAIYWMGNGLNGATQLFDYLKFSLATAIAPGYIATIISPGSTGYSLRSEYQAIAIIESIFGTFLWAGFIATFAKKYMR
jgi:hypothetical protein